MYIFQRMSYGLGLINPKKLKNIEYPNLKLAGFQRVEPFGSARKREGVIGGGK